VTATEAHASSADATPAIPPRQFLALLGLAAGIGLVVSLASFGFLELVHYLPQWVYEDLPDAVGYDDGAPLWWYLPVCALRGSWSPSPSCACQVGAGMCPRTG